MATTDRIIPCRTDPKITLRNSLGHAMINIVFETDTPTVQPPPPPIVATLTMPFDTNGDIKMDKADPRLPVDFKFSNLMSLKSSNKQMDCMLLVDLPHELANVPLHIAVTTNAGKVLAEDTIKNGLRVSMLFSVTLDS